MCTNTRFIRNKYTHGRVLVKCGKCEACLQEKANRMANRIRFAASYGLKSGQVQVLLTLTYDKYSVPYVRVSELLKYFHSEHFYDMPVFRDSERVRNFGCMATKLHTVQIGCVSLPPGPAYYNFKTLNKFHLNQSKGYGKIGIIFYKDLQDFQKRLLSVIRRSDSPFPVKFFNTAEYGETYCRPHFHVVCQFSGDRIGEFRNYVAQCWTYQDWSSPQSIRRFEVARDVSKYVASYVNKPDCVPQFLEALFPSKHSFSLYFGYDSELFSYEKIKAMVNRGDLHLPIFFDQLRGEMSYRLVPSHVICRYYPRFKGLCRLSPTEIADVLSVPKRLAKYAQRLDYSGTDLEDNIRLIRRCRARCSVSDNGTAYADEFIHSWSVWKLSLLRDFYSQQQEGLLPANESYDNAVDVLRSRCRLSAYGLTPDALLLPNEMPLRKSQTYVLQEQYRKKKKQKKVSSELYSDGTSVPIVI